MSPGLSFQAESNFFSLFGREVDDVDVADAVLAAGVDGDGVGDVAGRVIEGGDCVNVYVEIALVAIGVVERLE